jgi:hypothetical protein
MLLVTDNTEISNTTQEFCGEILTPSSTATGWQQCEIYARGKSASVRHSCSSSDDNMAWCGKVAPYSLSHIDHTVAQERSFQTHSRVQETETCSCIGKSRNSEDAAELQREFEKRRQNVS